MMTENSFLYSFISISVQNDSNFASHKSCKVWWHLWSEVCQVTQFSVSFFHIISKLRCVHFFFNATTRNEIGNWGLANLQDHDGDPRLPKQRSWCSKWHRCWTVLKNIFAPRKWSEKINFSQWMYFLISTLQIVGRQKKRQLAAN